MWSLSSPIKRSWDRFALAMPFLALMLMVSGPASNLHLAAHSQSVGGHGQDDADRIHYIGVLANRGVDACFQEWGPTAEYLSEQLKPYEFRILPLGFDEILDEVRSPDRRLSFVSANPSYYTYMEYHGLASRIATLQIPGIDRPESLFGGVIISRHDRTDIRELNDLRNKTFAAVDERSLGGWHAALKVIQDAGMNPDRVFSEVVFAGTHDQVVFDVIEGRVDAGTVRTTQLERMVAEGLLSMQQIRIIHDQSDRYPDYPYLISTVLYPEWPFAFLHGTDKDLSKRVAIALLMMGEDHPAALAIRGAGWTMPADYIEVHRLLRSLLLPPYEDYGITLGDTIRNYWPWLVAICILFVAMVVFSVIISILRHRTKHASNRLREAKQEAEAANKAKSEFLANMSHEIRTPLNGVIGFTDLLMSTRLSETQQLYVENAHTSASSLLSIINDILDLSKIEADKLELEIIETDIFELLGEATSIIEFHAAQKGLELLLNIQPDTPRFIQTDPARLKQVLVNLLSNAVKFTGEGEVELKLTFGNMGDGKGKFRFDVRDTGIGISEENQKRIFDVFMQADTSTTRKYGGTGLGLPISGLLAAKMGSRIELESEEQKGSTFFFTLETTYRRGEKLSHRGLKDVRRILVVDDNEKNRMILHQLFEHWGIHHTVCDSGKAALQIIRESDPFDVVIMDYHMPEMDGLHTIRRIREDLGLSHEELAIILLHSSADDSLLIQQCKKYDVRFSITKPIKSQMLLQYLENARQALPETTDVGPEKESEKEYVGSSKGPLILVAEDVEMNMTLLRTLLKKSLPGCRILEATNGRQAFDLWSSENPDLVLMDIQMPEMDGLQATAAIRNKEKEEGRKAPVPIIALTARTLKGESELFLKSGMNDFISKPINRNELNQKLHQYLSHAGDPTDYQSEI